jgi:hypothetical protein
LERGERKKKRVKEWVSLGAQGLLGGGVLLQGGAGLLLCRWFPAAREEGNRNSVGGSLLRVRKETGRKRKRRREKTRKRKEFFFQTWKFLKK